MNRINRSLALVGGSLFTGSTWAAGPDLSSLTGAVDLSTVGAAVLVVFAAVAGVLVIMKAGHLVLGAIRR